MAETDAAEEGVYSFPCLKKHLIPWLCNTFFFAAASGVILLLVFANIPENESFFDYFMSMRLFWKTVLFGLPLLVWIWHFAFLTQISRRGRGITVDCRRKIIEINDRWQTHTVPFSDVTEAALHERAVKNMQDPRKTDYSYGVLISYMHKGKKKEFGLPSIPKETAEKISSVITESIGKSS